MIIVPGAGGVSVAANGLEGVYAMDWARNIWADSVLRSTEALMSRRVVRHPHPATTRTRLNMLERLLRTYFVYTPAPMMTPPCFFTYEALGSTLPLAGFFHL
jgi:hypothetical protein